MLEFLDNLTQQENETLSATDPVPSRTKAYVLPTLGVCSAIILVLLCSVYLAVYHLRYFQVIQLSVYAFVPA